MSNDISAILWRRLKYLLSPQADLYKHLQKYTYNKRVLEIGFGTGAGTLQLRAQIASAWEIDPHAVDFAKDMWGNSVFWRVGDITQESAVFPHDIVLMIEVLEHIPDWKAALVNVCKSLTPKGKAIISGPNANASLRKNDKHEREWTAKEFKNGLLGYFKNVKLFEYSLQEEQGEDTTITPLIAVCSGAINNGKEAVSS